MFTHFGEIMVELSLNPLLLKLKKAAINLWQYLWTFRFLLLPLDEFMVSNSWIPQCLTLNLARNGALAALCIGVPDLWSISSTRASGLLGKYTPSWAWILLSASRQACFRSGPLGYGLRCTLERNESGIHTFLTSENKKCPLKIKVLS